ncbi:MAG: hypothetical protein ACRD30_02350 [Bryobacteraceae bacterium]
MTWNCLKEAAGAPAQEFAQSYREPAQPHWEMVVPKMVRRSKPAPVPVPVPSFGTIEESFLDRLSKAFSKLR